MDITSIVIASNNAGMVMRVDCAERFKVNTSIKEIMAGIIKLNEAPCASITAMVKGKKTAAIAISEAPAHTI